MRAHINDCLRALIGRTISILGLFSNHWKWLRLSSSSFTQARLKRKYGIARDTPVLSYGSEIVGLIHKASLSRRHDGKFAMTSGSTGNAKELFYPTRRLRHLKLTFSDMFMRACQAFQIRRTSLYVFSSFEADSSLTSLLLSESRLPNYFCTLQAPYRVQQHPAIQELVARYGSGAVRLWVLTISNPGVLYSTNPSTISVFLDEIARDWQQSTKLIQNWLREYSSFSPAVHKIARRLAARGHQDRLRKVATSDVPLPLWHFAPAVEAYICWTGGYVQPFLDRLATHLPPERYRLIPMYSMSTETIETLPYFCAREIAFLPNAPGVVYEFMDETQNLLDPHQLRPGSYYVMIVSDAYGLRRYRTDDIFLCRRTIRGMPDLVFARRRGLEYSFTGEKLTAEQLSIVFEQLRETYPSFLAGTFLTCVPSYPPHYKVLLIGNSEHSFRDLLAVSCDRLISEINSEYRSKRSSGRLGPIEVVKMEFGDFVAANPTWETQFKVLPLTGFHNVEF